jgi:hypothetical protein
MRKDEVETVEPSKENPVAEGGPKREAERRRVQRGVTAGDAKMDA